jgi:hypothetical protein
MLADPSEVAHLANIVVVLGISGDDRAVGPLIAFLESRADRPLTAEEYRARTSALMALGYHANRSASVEALAYLTAGLNPATWGMRVSWESPFLAGTEARNRRLVTVAAIGLSLSGQPSALPGLQSLLPGTVVDAAVVGDLIQTHATVAQRGLSAYYRENKP